MVSAIHTFCSDAPGESRLSASVHATKIVTAASVCEFLENSLSFLLAGKLIQNMHSRNSGSGKLSKSFNWRSVQHLFQWYSKRCHSAKSSFTADFRSSTQKLCGWLQMGHLQVAEKSMITFKISLLKSGTNFVCFLFCQYIDYISKHLMSIIPNYQISSQTLNPLSKDIICAVVNCI